MKEKREDAGSLYSDERINPQLSPDAQQTFDGYLT